MCHIFTQLAPLRRLVVLPHHGHGAAGRIQVIHDTTPSQDDTHLDITLLLGVRHRQGRSRYYPRAISKAAAGTEWRSAGHAMTARALTTLHKAVAQAAIG